MIDKSLEAPSKNIHEEVHMKNCRVIVREKEPRRILA